MTRILVWNIEDFDLNRISGGDLTVNDFYQETTANVATGRFDYIMANIRQVSAPNGGGAALPDIIVVIEVSAKPEYDPFGTNWILALRNIGRLAAGLGGQGAERLFRRIRTDTGNAHWMMAPPLMTGPKDAVAVFYDSSNYCFAGPLRWPGGNGPAREGGDVGGDYPPPFKDALPDTPIPAGCPTPVRARSAPPHRRSFTRWTVRHLPGTIGLGGLTWSCSARWTTREILRYCAGRYRCLPFTVPQTPVGTHMCATSQPCARLRRRLPTTKSRSWRATLITIFSP